MDAEKTKKVTEFLACVAGGAGAGFLDTKFSDKQVLGLAPGVVGGIGLAALGLTKYGGKLKGPILSAGEGMLAYEAGRMTAEKTAASISGVGAFPRRLGMNRARFGLPAGRAVSQAELAAQLQALRSRPGAFGGIY